MYFVKASDPRGPWSAPVRIKDPATISYGLGYDNSIFIDDSTILHGESECNRAQRNGFSFTENAKRGGDAAVLSLYLKSFELS
jgi:hypothetical protein